MKLTSDNQSLAASKVLILYVLNKAGKPLTNDGLLQLVLTIDEDMNYFYYQQFLLDLIENDYIINYSIEDEPESVYAMTPKGKEALSLTLDMLPGIVRLKIDSNIKEDLEEIENKFSIVADYIPRNENDYMVKCRIVENNITTFEVKTFATSREQAKQIAENWKKNATEIYPKIIDILVQ